MQRAAGTTRVLGPDDLLLTGSTLGHPPFRELVEAAAGAGFRGLSLWPRESYARARESGMSDAEMRAVLADHGIVVNDVDALVCWVGEGEPLFEGAPEALLHRAGEALGAQRLNVVMMSSGPVGVEPLAEAFAGVVDRAAEHGLTAHLEFVPFMAVPDAATAWEVVRLAGRPEAGILVDTWHCHRGPTRVDDLRAIPGERVVAIQVNDALAEPMPNPVEETLHHRLLPGEGAIDLAAWLGVLREIGSPAPLCAEVFSDALVASGTPREIALRVVRAMREVCGRVGAGAGRRGG